MGIQRKNKWKRKNIQKTERGKTKKKNKKNVRTKEKEKRKKIHIKKEHENEKKRGFNVRKIKEKIWKTRKEKGIQLKRKGKKVR